MNFVEPNLQPTRSDSSLLFTYVWIRKLLVGQIMDEPSNVLFWLVMPGADRQTLFADLDT